MPAAERDDAPVTASKNIEPERELFAETVTIARPPGELYAFWRDLTNVAPFMGAMVSIIPLDGKRARWTLKGSTDVYASWITLITEERPGATIFWQTEPGGDVDHGGRIDFLDAGARGSILRITLAFAVSKELREKGMFKQLASADPGAAVRAHVRRTLRSLKQMMEAREIATPFRHRRLMNVLSWQSEDKWKEKTMTDLGAIKEHMDIVGADGVHLGTVDRVEGHRIKLTLSDSGSHAGSEGAASAQKGGGHHHYISVGLVAAVEDGRVRLSADARNAALLEEEENGEALADFNRTASADDETGDEVAGDNAGDGKV